MSNVPNIADMTIEQRFAIIERLSVDMKHAARKAGALGNNQMQSKLLGLSATMTADRSLDHQMTGLSSLRLVDEAVRLLSEFQLGVHRA